MKTPSRRMPKSIGTRMGFRLMVIAFVMLVALIYLVVAMSWPVRLFSLASCVAIWLWADRSTKVEQRRLEVLAASRPGESICDFARSFVCRQIDTWVIRAVYEELQQKLQLGSPHFPVRASDDLSADLFKADPELIDMELVPAIASRAGRSSDDFRKNPYWGRVRTAADLVTCFNAQPRA